MILRVKSIALTAVSVRILSLEPLNENSFTYVKPAVATPINTCPTFSSATCGPAYPVTATPISEPTARLMPSAISRQHCPLTAVCSVNVFCFTPSSLCFTASVYETTPPATTAEAPGTEVSFCAIIPPVRDSAKAMVIERSFSVK